MEDGLGASHRLQNLHRLRWERPLQRQDIRNAWHFRICQRFLVYRNEIRWYHEVDILSSLVL